MSNSAFFPRAAVAAPHDLASQTGRSILAQGGNAIEAMIGMAATIAVVYPHMNGIGGDGFWLIRQPDGQIRYIEACGYVGSRATIAAYREGGYDTIPQRGPLAAITVPGAIGGWAAALDAARALQGRLPLRDLLNDAVCFARDGYPQSGSEARSQPIQFENLKNAPGFADTYLESGKIPGKGSTRRNKRLGDTLAYLGEKGLVDFYRGDIGRELAADIEKIGAAVTRKDLERFHAVVREPLALRLKGRTHFNSPPPTQGLASLVLLGVFDRLGVTQVDSWEHIHGLIEATKRALAIRDRVCTDADYLTHDPASFLSPELLGREAAAISMDRANVLDVAPAKGDTIWMGAIDSNGLAVSYIQSIYWEYGSGCVAPTTGVLMQNRGVSFSLDETELNPLTPGRRPFHTLNPALAVFDDGRVISYGAMGGDGQPQFQAQVFVRAAQFGMSLQQAIDAPRFLYGKTWGANVTSLCVEPRFDPEMINALKCAGHDVVLAPDAFSEMVGHAGALVRDSRGLIQAAHDPRSDGGAAGL